MVWWLRRGFPFTLYKHQGFKPKFKPTSSKPIKSKVSNRQEIKVLSALVQSRHPVKAFISGNPSGDLDRLFGLGFETFAIAEGIKWETPP